MESIYKMFVLLEEHAECRVQIIVLAKLEMPFSLYTAKALLYI